MNEQKGKTALQESNRHRKTRWFTVGAQEFARLFPNVAGALSGELGSRYVCPLCPRRTSEGLWVHSFGLSDLFNGGPLTVEHVPAKHSKGKELVLTCKRCNWTTNKTMDFPAAVVATMPPPPPLSPAAVFWSATPVVADLEVDGITVQARVRSPNGGKDVSLEVLPGEKSAAFQKAAGAAIAGGKTFKMTRSFPTLSLPPKWTKYSRLSQRAKVSWLKSGYLALFAILGYRYALHPELDRVREQIREPQTRHLPAFYQRLPGNLPLEQCRAFPIVDRDLPKCWGVQMGPNLVFLPGEASGDLYERIAELQKRRAPLQLNAEATWWPDEPLFGFSTAP